MAAGEFGKASGPRAGFWRRFAAYLLDAVLVFVVELILVALLKSVGYVISILLTFAYFTYFVGSSGQTLGMRALGVRVIDFGTGGAVGYGRAFVRYIGQIISGMIILLGYLWMLWDPEKQTWHDKIANTVVVPAREYSAVGVGESRSAPLS